MLYDSPCDEPGYFRRQYPEEYALYIEAKQEWEIDEYESRDLYEINENLI